MLSTLRMLQNPVARENKKNISSKIMYAYPKKKIPVIDMMVFFSERAVYKKIIKRRSKEAGRVDIGLSFICTSCSFPPSNVKFVHSPVHNLLDTLVEK